MKSMIPMLKKLARSEDRSLVNRSASWCLGWINRRRWLDFISRRAALIPKPRVNLTRFHGVFAPNSRYRAMVTPSKRGKGRKTKTANDKQDQTPAERHAAMTWAHRMKRVLDIDIA